MTNQEADFDSEVAYEILRSIRRILRKTSQHSREIARKSGLSVPQLLCLKTIGDQLPDTDVTAAMVAQLMHLSPPTITRIVDRLESAGYISRERDSRDRRKVCLRLTDLGRKRLDTLPTPLHDQFLNRLIELQPEERQSLLQSLERIVEMMEAEDIDAAPVLTPEPDVKPLR